MAVAPRPDGCLFVLQEFDDRLGARLDVELPVNGMEMGAHGAGADGELVGDFLVEVAPGQQREDLLLPFGELLNLGGGLLDLLEVADNLARDLHGHGRAASVDLFHRLEDFRCRHVLEEVTAGAFTQ